MITYVTPTEEAIEYGMRIPLSAVIEDDGITIHAYEEAREAAQWLDALSPTHLSDEILSHLDEMLRPIMGKKGFVPEERYVNQIGRIFAAENVGQIQAQLIREDTVRFQRREGLVYHTETVLDEESDGCPIFATVLGNEVRSFANLNGDDGEVADIGVETGVDYESRGYGASNVAALSRYLLEGGRQRVLYVALNDNIPSIRLAEKVGFAQVGEEYNYVCFEEAEEETDGI